MKNTRAALRYAKAALGISLEQKEEELLGQDMQLIIDVFAQNKSLLNYLENPVISVSSKRSALQKVFSQLNPLSDQLLDLLVKNNRIDLLKEVAIAFLELLQKQQGKEKAFVTTAVALTPVLEKTILEKAKELSLSKIELENIIDPKIIGGFILRIGDLQYNASVSYQLEQLKREFTKKNYSA